MQTVSGLKLAMVWMPRKHPATFLFCGHAILEPNQPFVVNDTHSDARFANNPLVTGDPKIRFYAGIPLQAGKSRLPVGTLCVIDDEPKELNPTQLESLSKLARQVERTLLLRDYAQQLSRQNTQLYSAIQANRAKTDFMSQMSHELRTPLNAIIGFSQLLQLEDNLDAQQADSVGEIHRAGEHLLALINDITDLSRIESGNIEVAADAVDLADVIEHAINLTRSLAAQKSIAVACNMPSEAAPLKARADATRLKQVILNLVSNGIKYNRTGGTAH